MFVTALGVGLWFAALNVQFRDVRHTIPFIVQIWLFATPIAYPSSLVPEPWRNLLWAQPHGGAWSRVSVGPFSAKSPPGLMIAVSSLVAIALLIGGMLYFRRMEKTFADVV